MSASHQLSKIAIAASVLVALWSAPQLRAEWGSIRANNRDRDAHSADRRNEHNATEHGRGEVEHGRPKASERREHEGPGVAERRVESERERDRHVETERERARARERDAWVGRHDAVDLDRHHGYYWSSYRSGMRVFGLPRGYLRLGTMGQPFYYYEGVFYQDGPPGTYLVVPAPVGVIVPALPPGAEAVSVNGAIYYYAAGTFYLAQPNGYEVVPPPLGVTVSILPPGAAPVLINGITYYTVNSVYYLPVMQNGVVVYMTVRP